MERRYFNPTPLLLAFGMIAFGLAGLSVADMFRPRPFDGLVLQADAAGRLIVQEVVPDSGAAKGGIEQGDEILGVGRNHLRKLRTEAQVARILNDFRIGAQAPYLVRQNGELNEIQVLLDERKVGDGTYIYSSVLGFSFFLVGLFVLIRQPTLRASQVFFMLCALFLLFLVCRMRPPSYSQVNTLILNIGTLAFLFLPASFLHFYLIFPRPVMLRRLNRRMRTTVTQTLRNYAWIALYLVPPLVFSLSFLLIRGGKPNLIHGAPWANWWLLAIYIVAGLVALGGNARQLRDPRERRGVFLVLFGSLFGLVPFLVSSLVLSAALHSHTFFFIGVMPLVLVPITFTYAVVRFQLLDIRVILRRSLLYTVTMALLTGLYAGGIATFYALFRGTDLVTSNYFPILLALAIVLLFEPLRRQMQEVIDRYFFAGRSRLQHAMMELGQAMTAQVDLQAVVQEVVEGLPQLLGLRFAALYLKRGGQGGDETVGQLYRVAGPERLPDRLPDFPELRSHLQRRRGGLTRLDQLGPLALRSEDVAHLVREFMGHGVEAVGSLDSPRRHLGLVLLSEKEGRILLEQEELDLLQGLLHQVALALETSLLLEERTQQAELERELEIAANIQAQLLPESLHFAEGWQVAAECLPARIVGGDFYTQLPSPLGDSNAIVFGDVSGKSVSGALMMMAAHESLHALAMTRTRPSELFTLANRRIYGLGRRSFVALGYFGLSPNGSLSYLVAGQPPPMLRRRDGTVLELPLPDHRIPVGALPDGSYEALEVEVGPGDMVLGYSDGVTDARSPAGAFFGTNRLREVLAQATGEPEEIMREVLRAVESFTGTGLQYDDLTLVAVGRVAEREA